MAKKRKLTDEEIDTLLHYQKYGWGGALSGALSGAVTGASMGEVFPPFGAVIGGVAGALVGGISGNLSENKADDERKKQINSARVEAEKQSFWINDKGNGSWTPPQFAYGGTVNQYSGQTHSGPNGGIPVDFGGQPSIMTGKQTVGLSEDGEVSHNGYIFSNRLKSKNGKTFAKEAKTILKKYKIRLGNDFSKNDKMAQEALETELNPIKEANDRERLRNQIGDVEENEIKKFFPGGPIGGTSTVDFGGWDYFKNKAKNDFRNKFINDNSYGATFLDRQIGRGDKTYQKNITTGDQIGGIASYYFNNAVKAVNDAILPWTGLGEIPIVNKSLGIGKFPLGSADAMNDYKEKLVKGFSPAYSGEHLANIPKVLDDPMRETNDAALTIGTGVILDGVANKLFNASAPYLEKLFSKFPSFGKEYMTIIENGGGKEAVKRLLKKEPRLLEAVNPETRPNRLLTTGKDIAIEGQARSGQLIKFPNKVDPRNAFLTKIERGSVPAPNEWVFPYKDGVPPKSFQVEPGFLISPPEGRISSEISSLKSRSIDGAISEITPSLREYNKLMTKSDNGTNQNVSNNASVNPTSPPTEEIQKGAQGVTQGVDETTPLKVDPTGAIIAGLGAASNIARGLFEKADEIPADAYTIKGRYSPILMRSDEAEKEAQNAYANTIRASQNMSPTQATRVQQLANASIQDNLSRIKERIFNINANRIDQARRGNIDIESRNNRTSMMIDQYNQANKAAKDNLISTGISQLGNVAQQYNRDKQRIESINKYSEIMKAAQKKNDEYMEKLINVSSPNAGKTISRVNADKSVLTDNTDKNVVNATENQSGGTSVNSESATLNKPIPTPENIDPATTNEIVSKESNMAPTTENGSIPSATTNEPNNSKSSNSYGFDINSYLDNVAGAESGNLSDEKLAAADAEKKKKGLTVSGRFQFTDDTFVRTYMKAHPDKTISRDEILKLKGDPDIQREIAEVLTKENIEILKRKKIPVTEENVYLTHVFGAGDATRVIQADANTKAKDILSKKVLRANNWSGEMSIGKIRKLLTTNYNNHKKRRG